MEDHPSAGDDTAAAVSAQVSARHIGGRRNAYATRALSEEE